jgi:hypothetical protein
VEILLWWLPPAVVTVVAMLWVGWLGRARDLSPDRSEAAQERFAAAILRELPGQVLTRANAPRPQRERSTGIAVRPSQVPGSSSDASSDEPSRRSA